MIYVFVITAIVLACVAALQFCYLLFLEARNRQQQQRIAELERENEALISNLQNIEMTLEEETQTDEEEWPEEVIYEGKDFSLG